MATHNLALLIKNPANEDEFLVLKQSPPPKFGDDEYDAFVDSDLYDFPSAQLNFVKEEVESQIVIINEEGSLDLSKFDIDSTLAKVLEEMGFGVSDFGEWRVLKYIEEAAFGLGVINSVLMTGNLRIDGSKDSALRGNYKWVSGETCMNWLTEGKSSSNRIGLLPVLGFLNEVYPSTKWEIPSARLSQEYPPGLVLVPMESRTAKPFLTTNLVVFAPDADPSGPGDSDGRTFAVQGDALLVDPGCRSQYHEELKDIIATLPRKLVVFVTHHHSDHVDGLSVVQKYNPDAILLAHENTMRRIDKGHWSLGYKSVSGDEEICIGGQKLRVIHAPGHTDGHMALLHVRTHSLIVGDHCVGQGSAILDITSGGNMSEYFDSTYKFLELSPNSLISMHGRVNLWPKHMLCRYLKNRRQREASILKAIKDGAQTLFDIVSKVYSDVDRSFWIPAASNVNLHVEHLAQQNKLPKVGLFNAEIQEIMRRPFSGAVDVYVSKNTKAYRSGGYGGCGGGVSSKKQVSTLTQEMQEPETRSV